jgi:hypothetical protein
MSERNNLRVTPTANGAADSESGRAVSRLQELQLMAARAREELRELENELHRQQGRVEVLLALEESGR